MVDLVYNGESLELPVGLEIPFELESGWFTNDLNKHLSFSFNLPYEHSPVNQRILRDLDLPYAVLNTDRVTVMFSIGGHYKFAELVFRSLNESLTVNLYFLSVEMASLNLTPEDIEEPNDDATINDFYTSGINQFWPDTKVYFPEIFNEGFYDDPSTDTADKVNSTFADILNHHNSGTGLWTVNTGGTPPNNTNTLVPQPALMGILQRFIREDGFELDGDFFRDPEARKLLAYNNLALDYLAANTLATAASQLYTINLGDEQRLNLSSQTGAGWSNGNNEYTVQTSGDFLVRFYTKVKATTGFIIQLYFDGVLEREIYVVQPGIETFVEPFSWVLADVGKTLHVIVKPQITSGYLEVEKSELEIMLSSDIISFTNPDTIQQFYPRMKFANLLNAVIVGFSLKMSVDVERKILYLNYKDSLLGQNSSVDLTPYWTGKLTPEFFKQDRMAIYYALPTDFEDGQQHFPTHLIIEADGSVNFQQELPIDFQGEELALQLHPLMEKVVSGSPTGYLQERGVSLVLDTKGKQVDKLRLSYYIGLVSNKPKCLIASGDRSLLLEYTSGSVGYGHIAWRQRYVRDNRFWKAELLMPVALLGKLDVEAIVAIDHIKYLIKKLSYSYGGSDMVVVQMECKRV